MATLFWVQQACCGGEAVSFLNSDQPDILTFLDNAGFDCVWHPFFTSTPDLTPEAIEERILSHKDSLSILVVEGAMVWEAETNGETEAAAQKGGRDRIAALARAADFTLAAGTCASFGGIAASRKGPRKISGLQFHKREPGGFLGREFRSRSGFPVINIPGCPAHPDWMRDTLGAIVHGRMAVEDLDAYQRPRIFYSKLAHHACPRNEYYEFKASAEEYSQQGCLFENLGCRGTLCESDCNERLWLARTGSCPRGGFPCLSCTSPDFPDGFAPFFRTLKIGNIPTTLPRDVPKAWYVGISGLAKLACPERLKKSAVSHEYPPRKDPSP